MKRLLSHGFVLLSGFLLGAWMFAGAEPRSLINLTDCQENCLKGRDLAGALGSFMVRRVPDWTPLLLDQSERCVAVRHWAPRGDYHRVYLPRRDVRNIMELAQEDLPYLTDCLALARKHLQQAGIRNYRVVSNGPGSQHLTYFHFHVISPAGLDTGQDTGEP